MKRLLFVLLSILLLFSCTQPTVKTQHVYVYDSAWHEVLTTTVEANTARAVSLSDIEVQVAEYNAAHNDDQYFLKDEEVPVTEAPDATAYIVRNDTYAVMYQAVVPRTDVVERRAAYDLTVQAMADPVTLDIIPCTLFIDKVPELPPTPVIDPYVAWCYYIVDGRDGSIYLEEHCTEFNYWTDRLAAADITIRLMNRDDPTASYYLIRGQLYIPPTVATTP